MKKTLSIILAALMLVSCIPIFASAATRLNADNIEIVPPTLTPTEINFGDTFASSVTASGGEMYHVASDGTKTRVAGTFQLYARETGPSAPTKDYAPTLRFVSADTTAYSSIAQIRKISYEDCLAEGYSWPTVTVKGKEATIETMPTVSDSPRGGNVQTYSTITGGKVVCDGVDVTAEGTWSFTTYYYLEESAYVDIQWKADGYYTLTAQAWVNVYANKATIKELPAAATLTGGNPLYKATLSGGIVEDENGNDITSSGFWSYDSTVSLTYPAESGEFPVKWEAIGYEILTAPINVTVDAIKVTLEEAPAFTMKASQATSKGTATGGKITVVGGDGTDITSLGKWSSMEAWNYILYENSEVRLRWLAEGYAPIETTVIADVQTTTVSLTTAPKIGDVPPGTTMKQAAAKLSGAAVYTELGTADTRMDSWSVIYPDGYTDDTVLTEDITVTAVYNKTGFTTLSCEVSIHVLDAVPAFITEVPTVSADGVIAGNKVSALKIVGGAADCEGTFVFESPDQVLSAGNNKITLIFVPATPANSSASCSVTVHVKGVYAFLDKDGNETVPVYTISYGTRLSDSNTNILAMIAQTDCYFSATSNYSFSAPEGKDAIISKAFNGILLPVGEHTFDVRVKNIGYSVGTTPPYEETTLQFIVKVLPVEMNVRSVYYSALSGELTVTIDNTGAKGTLDIYVDDVLVGDDVDTTTYGSDTFRTAKITTWTPEVSYNKEYNVKVIYNSIENDPVSMADYESTFRTNLMMSVAKDSMFSLKVNGMEISGAGSDMVNEGNRITCSVPYLQQADFISWYIVDENGNPIDVEIYGIEKKRDQFGAFIETKVEATLTDYEINFDMPNGNVRVYYKTQAMLDAEIMQEAIDNCDCICHHNNPVSQFIWKIISFFMDLFGITKDCSCGYPHGAK